MIAHLRAVRDEPGRSSYPGLSLSTLQALERRKLVRSTQGLGSMAFPHTSIKWTATDEGRGAAFQLHHTTDSD